MQEQRDQLRTMVRGAYDLQKLRIQMGNRIVGNFKVKLGQEPGKKEEGIDAEGKKILKDLRERFRKLTDGVATFPRQSTFTGDGVISNYTELCLIAQYMLLESAEDKHFRHLGTILETLPIWTEYLEGVKGIGPAMAGVIVSEIDIHKARYPSSIWWYAGLGVKSDGRGQSRRKEHQITIKYKDKNGKDAERQGIDFNPFLKTKLLGVLASSFLRAIEWGNVDKDMWDSTPEDRRRIKKKDGEEFRQVIIDESPYRVIYYDYKHRLENHARYGVANDGEKDDNDRAITSKGQRHRMAMRYMIKMFLIDLYRAWRELEGLVVEPTYQEAKLRKTHVA